MMIQAKKDGTISETGLEIAVIGMAGRKLKNAVNDGDHIYAMAKGSISRIRG
jgi:acyl transferase domain-containing protein